MLMIAPSYAEPILHGQNGAVLILDLPTFIAVEKGFFTENKLDIVEPVIINNAATSMVALTTGQVKFFGAIGMYSIVQGYYNMPLVSIGRPVSINTAFLYSRKDITKISDLKGKIVTIGGLNDSSRLYAETILNAGGLKNTDFEWFVSPDSSTRLMALRSGRVDASLFMPPYNFLAEREDFNNLGNAFDFKFVYHKSLAFNKEWADKNTDKVKAIILSFNQAIEWLYDTNNRNEAAAIFSKVGNLSFEDALHSYDWAIANNIFVKESGISKSIYEEYVKTAREWQNIKPNVYIPLDEIISPGANIIP